MPEKIIQGLFPVPFHDHGIRDVAPAQSADGQFLILSVVFYQEDGLAHERAILHRHPDLCRVRFHLPAD